MNNSNSNSYLHNMFKEIYNSGYFDEMYYERKFGKDYKKVLKSKLIKYLLDKKEENESK